MARLITVREFINSLLDNVPEVETMPLRGITTEPDGTYKIWLGDSSAVSVDYKTEDATTEVCANVLVRMEVKPNESEDRAYNRFYDLLYSGLCETADSEVDFEITSQEIREKSI